MVTKRWRIVKDSSKPDIVRVLARRGMSVDSFLASKDLSTDSSVQRLIDELQEEHCLSDGFLEALTKMSNKANKSSSKKSIPVATPAPEPIVEDLVCKTEEEEAVAFSAVERDNSEEDSRKNNKKKKVDA